MRERVVVAAGLGVITDEEQGVEALVELLHHAEGMAAPAADQPGAIRQARGDDVAAAVMGVLDQDLFAPASIAPLAGGDHLIGHPRAELLIGGVRLLGLFPVGDAGGAFDIGADIDFHDAPLTRIVGVLAARQLAARDRDALGFEFMHLGKLQQQGLPAEQVIQHRAEPGWIAGDGAQRARIDPGQADEPFQPVVIAGNEGPAPGGRGFRDRAGGSWAASVL